MGEHGLGTGPYLVEKTRKDGTIRRRWVVGVTMNGRRVWRWRATKHEAERAKAQLIEDRDLDLDPTRQTVAGYLRSWIESQRNAKHRRIRERTLIGYARIIEQRIIPELGSVTLARLSKRRIQAWVDAQDGSPQTVRNDHAVLRKALAHATGDVLPSNPAIGVELPERREFAGSPLTLEEAKRLLDVTKDDRLHALWRLALFTGLRAGELLGLSRDALEVTDAGRDYVSDGRGVGGVGGDRPRGSALSPGADAEDQRAVGPRRPRPDLERTEGSGRVGRGADHRRALGGPYGGHLRVSAQLQRINGRWVLGPTKAARKLERIALDPITVEVVRDHLRRMAEDRKPGWRYHGLMFVTAQGQPYHQSTVLAEFRRACERAGIRPRRFHDLRHTHNRLLKDAGIDKDTRKARMGHATDVMSARYGGASEVLDQRAVETLAEAIG